MAKDLQARGEAARKEVKAAREARADEIAKTVLNKKPKPIDAKSAAKAVEEGRAAAGFLAELEAARGRVEEAGTDNKLEK